MSTVAQTLDRAVRRHKAGDLQGAQQLYSQVLRAEPKNVDALHLMGLIAGQFGRHDLAITLINQAISLKPDFADAHNNLGNAFRSLNKLPEAEASYQRALNVKPNCWEAHNNLGAMLREQGQLVKAVSHWHEVVRLMPNYAPAYRALGEVHHQQMNLDAAAASFRQALRLEPNHVATHNDLGNVLLAQGKLDEAAGSFERALRIQPDLAEVHSNLGFVLRQQGKTSEAIAHCRDAVRLDPNLAAGHVNLANALLDEEKIEQSIASYSEAIRLDPHLAEAHNNRAISLRKTGALDDAHDSFREALRIKPDYAEAHSNLGSLLRVRGILESAETSCREALRLRPGFADAQSNLGQALQAQGKFDEALASFREAVRLQPKSAAWHNNLSVALLAQGHLDQAISHLHEALRLAPGDAVALHQLGRLARDRKYEFSADELNEVQAELAQSAGASRKKVLLHFTLAHVAEQNGDHALAFEHYLAGNACKRQVPELWTGFDIQKVRDDVDSSIANFDCEFFQRRTNAGHPSDVPVFIVGMPRSGTTLVEQILSSHPNFGGAGELTEIGSMAGELPSYPACAVRLDQATIMGLADRYLQRLKRDAAQAVRVSDKMPLNFLHLGLITVLFPNARVVHCRRDPRDTCVSCFCENFENVPFATSLEDLGQYYVEYTRLMAHWKKVLPIRTIELRYEDLVSEPEALTRQLLEFCGLDWDDRCLRFHQSRRPVQTASSVQVRHPIYARSVGRWQRYQTFLGPLLEHLQPR